MSLYTNLQQLQASVLVRDPGSFSETITTEQDVDCIIARISSIAPDYITDNSWETLLLYTTNKDIFSYGRNKLAIYIDDYLQELLDNILEYQSNLNMFQESFLKHQIKEWFLYRYDMTGFIDSSCDPSDFSNDFASDWFVDWLKDNIVELMT
jgi:hypothetical protein